MSRSTIDTVMSPENFVDILNVRADMIVEAIAITWSLEQAGAAAKAMATNMIDGIVKSYNDRPHLASEAFEYALSAWSLARSSAISKINAKIDFSRSRNQATGDLEKNKELIDAYFASGTEFTDKILRDLAEEFCGMLDEGADGEEYKAEVKEKIEKAEGGVKLHADAAEFKPLGLRF